MKIRSSKKTKLKFEFHITDRFIENDVEKRYFLYNFEFIQGFSALFTT